MKSLFHEYDLRISFTLNETGLRFQNLKATDKGVIQDGFGVIPLRLRFRLFRRHFVVVFREEASRIKFHF